MNADPSAPRRRFQFRLRTLLIVATLFCVVGGYVASQAKTVQQRRDEWNRAVNRRQIDFRQYDDFGVLNWTRRALGDKVVYIIYVPEETDPAELTRLHAIFPEGRIRLLDFKTGHNYAVIFDPAK